MNNYKCPYGEMHKENFKQWIQCEKQNDICVFIRYCPTKRSVEHSENARYCPIFLEQKEKN